MKTIIKRILCIYNVVPLFIVPTVIWGYDLGVHLLLQPIVSTKLWLAFLTISLPIIGYLTVSQIYKHMRSHIDQILPLEITGVIGMLYAQPCYMIILTISFEGIDSISLTEAIKTILLLMPIVPFSTVMISASDGTLLAVPLACLAMLLAGGKYRRARKI